MQKFKEHLKEAGDHLSQNDKVLRSIIKASGICTIKPGKQHYNVLLNSIISQQLSVKAAATIRDRVYSHFESLPAPEEVLRVDQDRLRQAGLSRQKAIYVHELSKAFTEPELALDRLHRFDDDQVYSRLIGIKGIGEWTIHMFLIFGLGRLDVLPHGDLGIQNAAKKFYRLRTPVTRAKLEKLGEKWKPYRSVAAWYLWRGLELQSR